LGWGNFASPFDHAHRVLDDVRADVDRRWAFEILLAEFRALREEIVTVKTQLERTYAYLFALIGAIVASQLLHVGATGFLKEHVWIIIVAALVAMWFPINHQLMSTDMVLAGTYIRDILAPKLNFLAYTSVAKDNRSQDEVNSLLGWTDPIKGKLRVDLYREVSRRPMSWEHFMAHMRLHDKRRGRVFLPLYVARGLILYVPTLALLVFYVHLQSERRSTLATRTVRHSHVIEKVHYLLGIDYGSIIVFVVVVALIIWSAIGQFQTAQMLRHGTRSDSHNEIPPAEVIPNHADAVSKRGDWRRRNRHICPNHACSQETPAHAAFCPSCGWRLASVPVDSQQKKL
jgi:hypothetical protein